AGRPPVPPPAGDVNRFSRPFHFTGHEMKLDASCLYGTTPCVFGTDSFHHFTPTPPQPDELEFRPRPAGPTPTTGPRTRPLDPPNSRYPRPGAGGNLTPGGARRRSPGVTGAPTAASRAEARAMTPGDADRPLNGISTLWTVVRQARDGPR